MLKRLNNYIYSSIFLSIIFVIIGILFIAKPDISFEAVNIVFMSMFIINGIVLLILDFRSDTLFIGNFMYGIVSLVLGIIFLMHPNALGMILPFMIGIWFLVSGLLNLKFSFYLKSESTGYMILSIIMAVISIACGVTLISKPLEGINLLTMSLGLIFIMYSVANIIDMVTIKININRIVKRMTDYIKRIS